MFRRQNCENTGRSTGSHFDLHRGNDQKNSRAGSCSSCAQFLSSKSPALVNQVVHGKVFGLSRIHTQRINSYAFDVPPLDQPLRRSRRIPWEMQLTEYVLILIVGPDFSKTRPNPSSIIRLPHESYGRVLFPNPPGPELIPNNHDRPPPAWKHLRQSRSKEILVRSFNPTTLQPTDLAEGATRQQISCPKSLTRSPYQGPVRFVTCQQHDTLSVSGWSVLINDGFPSVWSVAHFIRYE